QRGDMSKEFTAESNGLDESQPGTTRAPDHGLDSGRLADLRDVLDKTKIRLLQQILASQTGALAAVELAARNEITESTIRDHLRNLQNRERPVVTQLDATTDGPVPNGIPRKYYAVTEYGIDLLQQLGLYEQIGVLYDVYEAADLELPDAEGRPTDIRDIDLRRSAVARLVVTGRSSHGRGRSRLRRTRVKVRFRTQYPRANTSPPSRRYPHPRRE
ncbi:MAG: hypothetical protein ABEI99_01495, partial [Halobaculum sp.]